MANHPNRAAPFHLLRPLTMNTRTLAATYETVSRHRTMDAAVAAGQALHRKESLERMPHRVPTITTEFVVMDIRTGTETSV